MLSSARHQPVPGLRYQIRASLSKLETEIDALHKDFVDLADGWKGRVVMRSTRPTVGAVGPRARRFAEWATDATGLGRPLV